MGNMTPLENQTIKNLTWKLAASFVVGAFVFGLTVSGAVYAYMDRTDKRFARIENRMERTEIMDSLRRNEVNYKFERLFIDVKNIKDFAVINKK